MQSRNMLIFIQLIQDHRIHSMQALLTNTNDDFSILIGILKNNIY